LSQRRKGKRGEGGKNPKDSQDGDILKGPMGGEGKEGEGNTLARTAQRGGRKKEQGLRERVG